MADKPVIFISYSHRDEPTNPTGGEVAWLSFVRRYLQPAIKHGVFDLFVDEHLHGGDALDPEIERKLRSCDIFLLLISASSTASTYILDNEIRITRERQASGEDVHFYPLLLTPTPKVALDKLRDMVIRPRDAKPLSSFPYDERLVQMNLIADEIAEIVSEVVGRKPELPKRVSPPAYVHTAGLPETAYERLVGREDQLKRLDEAWKGSRTSIVSLVAEGGAGKSALVNEWLKNLQADNYRGAEVVLGWSFYSQGSKERATSAEGFLNWALEKLGIATKTNSASAKGDALADALAKRRVLLVLDGVEPLQHGPGTQAGQLKDLGIRALLRRFAAVSPSEAHGMIVATSRLTISDIARWKDTTALVTNIEQLSGDAGAALLRDNGVWGTDKELLATAHEFGGHPLALGLLATFLKETQFGDVRRRDRVSGLVRDDDNPRHGHAKRVMESYENEWLKNEPVLQAILGIVGLFDRPASSDCLKALRRKPAINGLTDRIVKLDDSEWTRAVTRLREVRLLSPESKNAPNALDAHPLVREWFGERLLNNAEPAWRFAHSRLYDHLRRTTREGKTPTLEDLAPLYQALAHGCSAGRHQEALERIYANRICRIGSEGLEFYSTKKLGAVGFDLTAMRSFFSKPYEELVPTLIDRSKLLVLGQAGYCLRAQGRFIEALPPLRAFLELSKAAQDWLNHAIAASTLSTIELLVGEIAGAIVTSAWAVELAKRSGNKLQAIGRQAHHADVLHAAGRSDDAARLFVAAERGQQHEQPEYPLLYSVQGYFYCDLLLARGDWTAAEERATQSLRWGVEQYVILGVALDSLTLGRANLGSALNLFNVQDSGIECRRLCQIADAKINDTLDALRLAGKLDFLPRGLLTRAAFRRSVGDWGGAARDLDEVLEIAEPGPMKLFLCDMALECARLAFAQIEAFAPLNGMLEKDNPAKPEVPTKEKIAELKAEAGNQIKIADDYIQSCGYHRRDEELAELKEVLAGKKTFASLPPRV